MAENLNLESYPCPVCSTSETRNLYSIQGFDLVQCNSCNQVYVNPRIKNEDLFTIYSDKYFHSNESGYEDYELTESLRIKTFERWYNEIKNHLKIKSGHALDIGCAAGYFLQILQENNWDAEGIELEKQMRHVVSEKGFPVYDTPLEYFKGEKKYSLITLFDVLEHLPNLSTNIVKLTEILDTNGSIALVTPDFNSSQRKIMGKKWFQFKPKEHIQYFSIQTLAKVVAPAGLKIVYHSASGQYADSSFLYNRLNRYGFTFIANIFNSIIKILRLADKSWYADTGSMLVILQKKE